jgi:hypothetical protein
MISAIVTLSPDTADLGGLRKMIDEAKRLSAPGDLPGSHGNTFDAVIAFVETLADEDDSLSLVHGTDLGVDLPIRSISFITCGEHAGATPENLFVTVNPGCDSC